MVQQESGIETLEVLEKDDDTIYSNQTTSMFNIFVNATHVNHPNINQNCHDQNTNATM